jgi:hypothetical protein
MGSMIGSDLEQGQKFGRAARTEDLRFSGKPVKNIHGRANYYADLGE